MLVCVTRIEGTKRYVLYDLQNPERQVEVEKADVPKKARVVAPDQFALLAQEGAQALRRAVYQKDSPWAAGPVPPELLEAQKRSEGLERAVERWVGAGRPAVLAAKAGAPMLTVVRRSPDMLHPLLRDVVNAVHKLGEWVKKQSTVATFVCRPPQTEQIAAQRAIIEDLQRGIHALAALDGVVAQGGFDRWFDGCSALNAFLETTEIDVRLAVGSEPLSDLSSGMPTFDAGIKAPLFRLSVGAMTATDLAPRHVPLTAAEAKALERLTSRPPVKGNRLVLFCDPNRFPGDLSMFTLLKHLHSLGHLKVDAAVITTTGDEATRRLRACTAKALFDSMGMPDVPVGVGAEYPGASMMEASEHEILAYEFLSRADAVRQRGLELLVETLEAAEPGSLNLVCTTGMTDLAALLRLTSDVDFSPVDGGSHPPPAFEAGEARRAQLRQLFKEKVARVTVMSDHAGNDGGTWVRPQNRASNNRQDWTASQEVFYGLQKLGIPLTILNREAAYEAPIDTRYFSRVAETNHPVAIQQNRVQKRFLEGLFRDILADRRPGLTVQFFFETFTDLNPTDATDWRTIQRLCDTDQSFDAVWAHVTKLYQHDPMTLLAAVPSASAEAYTPAEVRCGRHATGVWQIGPREVNDPEFVVSLQSALSLRSLGAEAPLLGS